MQYLINIDVTNEKEHTYDEMTQIVLSLFRERLGDDCILPRDDGSDPRFALFSWGGAFDKHFEEWAGIAFYVETDEDRSVIFDDILSELKLTLGDEYVIAGVSP